MPQVEPGMLNIVTSPLDSNHPNTQGENADDFVKLKLNDIPPAESSRNSPEGILCNDMKILIMEEDTPTETIEEKGGSIVTASERTRKTTDISYIS